MQGTKIILGASSKGGDAAERFAGSLQQYVDDAEVLNPLDYAFDPIGEVLSATDFRNALRNNEDIDKFIPAGSKDKAEIIADMVKEKLQENTQPFLGIFRGLVEEVLQEVYSDKQRRWACAQAGESRKDFDDPSLSKDEAEEMCKSKELKEEEEELEEMTGAGAVAGYAGPIGKPKRRKRKLDEKEVNEALNYLLQKLGV